MSAASANETTLNTTDVKELSDSMQDQEFIQHHIGPNHAEVDDMLDQLKLKTLDELIEKTVPQSIYRKQQLDIAPPISETATLQKLKALAQQNRVFKSYIGMGYHDTIIPPVILRNVLENPGWYTAYTPYQPEISQGRLEALLTFQQMVIDLTGMEMANASLLDEATAAAEAMTMCKRVNKKNKSQTFFIANNCHQQTVAVVKTRAQHFGFDIVEGDPESDLAQLDCFGALVQYPGSTGEINDIAQIIETAHSKNTLVAVAADIMSLLLLRAPGDLGADMVVGSTQRFGVPMGFGGPHAAFFAFRDKDKRSSPGRVIGVSIDRNGNNAYRMAMQTREQHIRREKANSNICTSQALLAILAACYAMYHGPNGLRQIAQRIYHLTSHLASHLVAKGFTLKHQSFFDTLTVAVGTEQKEIINRGLLKQINFRKVGDHHLGVSINEKTTPQDIATLIEIFTGMPVDNIELHNIEPIDGIPGKFHRKPDDQYLTHAVFNLYHSETKMMRYLKRLENRDITLTHSMIPLGSCTMKLNSAVEMIPVTWPEYADIHPFAPIDQAQGYLAIFADLERMLQAITGYDAVSLQPNAGSQGEYAGLLAIKHYHDSNGQSNRHICLIPTSAHGTNPASAQMAGMKIVLVACDDQGNVDLTDLKNKAEQHSADLAALMVTYPSTHGVYEEAIVDICDIIHQHGGQVYLDGANLNALVGVAAPGKFGADVSHLNLHKTFSIPHGGGGPGMGPIAVKSHLAPFLPNHPVQPIASLNRDNPVISAATWGSPGILPISWAYITLMGHSGLKRATQIAILNANYIAKKLSPHYPVLYTGQHGFVAHECIIDLRPIKQSTGVNEEDIAKRLMDYGFHAPTMSFPVPGTLMIEPTESESKDELDRFIEALIAIRKEIIKIERKEIDANNNPLKNAPHPVTDLVTSDWDRPYTTEEAVFPLPWLRQAKYWPPVARIDNVYGDRNLFCSCPSIENYE